MSSPIELNYAPQFTKLVLRRQSLESNVRFRHFLTYKLFGPLIDCYIHHSWLGRTRTYDLLVNSETRTTN